MRDFAVVDAQTYSIELCYDPGKGGVPPLAPAALQQGVTFYRSKPFNLEATYPQEAAVPHPDMQLGSFTMNKGVSAAEDEASKASAGCANDGDLATTGATSGEEAPPTEGGDPDKVAEGEPVKKEERPSPKEKQAKATELPVEVRVPQLSAFEMDQLVEREVQMVHKDRTEKERLLCHATVFGQRVWLPEAITEAKVVQVSSTPRSYWVEKGDNLLLRNRRQLVAVPGETASQNVSETSHHRVVKTEVFRRLHQEIQFP
ncbi:hypothetical protein HPB47_002734 [Ixodes persulcatus]|uniref:Uncharacterized protein n=1 Tax=Ixodes persulcatus TaxID=34615 RepID=A0AC60PKE3_IXOPE|nr:hypothetical protein HPB47_002734 [Ixodes persulcatus]